MKNFVTLTLTVVFCTVLTSFNLIGQCASTDPTVRGIVPNYFSETTCKVQAVTGSIYLAQG